MPETRKARSKKRSGKRAAKKRKRAGTDAVPRATGEGILATAAEHEGEQYILGARAPMANPNWDGPWDCAEFASWCLFQSSGLLFGVRPTDDPVLADAYTGYWAEDATGEARIGITEASRIPGAMLLRAPSAARGGHIAISDGSGGTIEAHGSQNGVSRHGVSGRRWDTGVLVPGVRYVMNEEEIAVSEPTGILRLTRPLMGGAGVLEVQTRLDELGYHPGALDGIFGSQTQSAVIEFQRDNGLVADGEVGPLTLASLGFD